MTDLVSIIQRHSRKRDMRVICNTLMPLARRNTPLTREEKETLINIQGVYRTLVRSANKRLVDYLIFEVLEKK
jgi:hypothetical protein